MLSFFLRKKNCPDTPNEIIQGPSDSVSNNSADDFIFVEKKNNVDPTPSSHAVVYPPMPSGIGGSYPMPLYPPQKSQATITVNVNQTVVPYVQDVPFVIAPQLLINSVSDLTQIYVDGLLALMTREISVEEKEDYTFALERSIQNDCY